MTAILIASAIASLLASLVALRAVLRLRGAETPTERRRRSRMAGLFLFCFVPPVLVIFGRQHNLAALLVAAALALGSIVLHFRGEARE